MSRGNNVTERPTWNGQGRRTAAHVDGTPIFINEDDQRAEREVAALIAAGFHCQVRSFGLLAPIDWYATRDERLVGLIEFKRRTHTRGTYPTVYLNTRKWLALTLGAIGLGVPAIFVVQWADACGYVNVANIDASVHRMGGWTRMDDPSVNEVEPVIDVPIDLFRSLKGTARP